MDLSTTYLGLRLPHPFVAGASPLADTIERCQQLESVGIAAIVLRSLFEEQLVHEALAQHQAEFGHVDSHGEALSYLPSSDGCVFGPEAYLQHLRAVKRAVAVPVIASLNGDTEGGWVDYARHLDAAGADALELNLYSVATEPSESAAELEERLLRIVAAVCHAVRLPVAVKLSPFFTALPNFTLRLEAVGARGFVLFNRFFEPDVDLEALEFRTTLSWSDSRELLLRLRWLALLSAQVRGSLAVSGGVHSETDAIKAVMCGAHAVQLVGELLRAGLGRVQALRTATAGWLEEHGYRSLQQMRGCMDSSRSPDPRGLERVNYMRLLQTYRGE